MYLHALATAVPERAFTQAECWDIVDRSPAKSRLHKRSRLILHSVLKGDHGIKTRHFAVPKIESVFDMTADQLNTAFKETGPALAARALETALSKANLKAHDLDALLICTCTGYLCPGLSSYVSEMLGVRSDAYLQDLVGLGCGAAIPTLRSASHIVATNPKALVACVAVEVCSAAFFLDDDPGVLISACLFGDGAVATLWKGVPGPQALRCFGFQTLHLPAERDKLRFEMKDGKLRNLLHRTVPDLAANAVSQLWNGRGDRPVSRVVTHTGGQDVLAALGAVLPSFSLETSAKVLRENGNMSSPSVLFGLEETLKEEMPTAKGDFWLVSFGAGFSAHSCRVGAA